MPESSKKVDESWKEQAQREKREGVARSGSPPERPAATGAVGPAEAPGAGEEFPQARFDLFLSGLAMEALIALGDMAHPTTRKQAANLPHARYLIDLIGILEEKTKGNLSADEERLLKDTLYQLRMRYLTKAGGA
jgi:hypothetical protein